MVSLPLRAEKKNLVEDSNYREMNLAINNIYMRSFYEELPNDVARLVDYVRMDRDSPGSSLDQLRQDTDLYDLEMGAQKPPWRVTSKQTSSLHPNFQKVSNATTGSPCPNILFRIPDPS